MNKQDKFLKLIKSLGVTKYLVTKGCRFTEETPRFTLYLLTTGDNIERVNSSCYSFVENEYGYDDEDSSITFPRAADLSLYDRLKLRGKDSLEEVFVNA